MNLDTSQLPSTLGVIPLRNAVMFPGGRLPLALGDASSRVVDAASEGYVVLVSRRESASDGVSPADFFEVGTLSRIIEIDRTQGQYKIVVDGLGRCRLQWLPGQALRTRLDVVFPSETEVDEATIERIRSLGLQFVHRTPGLPAAALSLVRDIDVPGHLIDLIVANVDLPIPDKQAFLEIASVKERAELATRVLTTIVACLPAPQLSGAQCGLHGVPAEGTCRRCGTFICAGCRGPGGKSPLCKLCRSREVVTDRVSGARPPVSTLLAAMVVPFLACGSTFFGLSRVLSDHAATGMTLGAVAMVGVVSGSVWLRSRWVLPKPGASWEFWAALLALLVNGAILFALRG